MKGPFYGGMCIELFFYEIGPQHNVPLRILQCVTEHWLPISDNFLSFPYSFSFVLFLCVWTVNRPDDLLMIVTTLHVLNS